MQNRFLLGRGANILGADRGTHGRPAGQVLGGRSVARRDPLLARGHAVRGDVRADGAGAPLHDPRVRRQVQRERGLRRHAHADAG